MNITETKFEFNEILLNRSRTNYIILHHRAGNGDVYSIHDQHLNQGYAGIGYHFYVRKDGSIYRGRPINKIGAHCLNNNHNSIGICFEGDFENEIMPQAQKKAGAELVQYLKNTFKGIKVMEHKDMMATACPGKNFPFAEIADAGALKEELVSANDITWELSQMIEINDVDGFVKALNEAKKANSPLYWGYRKVVNR